MPISGEQFQELCSVYIGTPEDFAFNPRISAQSEKHLNVNTVPDNYCNPPLIFCYTHRIHDLVKQLDKFRFPFILVSHNSDTTIDDSYRPVAAHPKIFHWFTQNLNILHPKISMLPIGVANSQWPHGRRDLFLSDLANKAKTDDLYFQFGPSNIEERQRCYAAISRFYPFQPQLQSCKYLARLATHRFCISPEGAGVDCHRIWEALFCNCVPIIKDCTFAQLVAATYPVIIIKDWDQVTPDFIAGLQHKSVDLRNLDLSFYNNQILSKASDMYNSLTVSK